MTGLHGLAFLNHGEARMDFQPLWIGVVVWMVLILAIILAVDVFG